MRLAGLIFASALLVFPALVFAQWDDAEIESTDLGGGIYMLTGVGGNMGLCVGEDGAFLIDDQFAPLHPKIMAAIQEISPKPVRFVLNTHYHGDHVGGNEAISGTGAIIVSHRNVRHRVSTDQINMLSGEPREALGEDGWPKITFTEEMTFHWNDEDIRVFHMPHAHTDGDGLVHFPKANIIHTGDVFFNGLYPFIDTAAGGSVNGIIAAAEAVRDLCDADTRIIPGHGSLTDRDGLDEYLRVVKGVRAAVQAAIKGGKSLEQAQKDDVLSEFNPVWGQSFIQPDKMVEIVYNDLKGIR